MDTKNLILHKRPFSTLYYFFCGSLSSVANFIESHIKLCSCAVFLLATFLMLAANVLLLLTFSSIYLPSLLIGFILELPLLLKLVHSFWSLYLQPLQIKLSNANLSLFIFQTDGVLISIWNVQMKIMCLIYSYSIIMWCPKFCYGHLV